MRIGRPVIELQRQCLYGLALGGENLSDHGALRRDMAINGGGRQSRSRQLQNRPQELVLDLDATDNPLHGQQEGRLFHGYDRSGLSYTLSFAATRAFAGSAS